MKHVTFWMLVAGLLTSACSNNEKSEDSQVSSAEGVESEADFLVDSESDFLFEEDLVFEEGSEAVAEEQVPVQEDDYLMAMEEEGVSGESSPMVSSMKEHVVQKGETLMMVAFHLYGDYEKWKDLKQWNPSISGHSISEGQVLQYEAPAEKFSWNPSGLPYVVRRGDSLGSISDDKYGTIKRWREIYDNNQPLIKDPNLIFAGFTLYYVPDRDLASE